MYSQFAKETAENSAVHANSPTGQPSTTRARKATNATSAQAQQHRSANRYLDRITIAGLHNYLYARGKCEKITWKITFLLAIAGTVYYLVPPVEEYLKSTIVLDIQHQTEPAIRLPNPWVCHFGINWTYMRQQFEKVRPELEADKRVQVLGQRYKKIFGQTANVDNLIYVAIRFMTALPLWADEVDYNWKESYMPPLAFEFIAKAINAMGSNWTGVASFHEKAMFDCHTVVMNCTLDGMAFECCRDGQLGRNKAYDKCFALDIRREVREKHLQQNQTKPFELQFETLVVDPSTEFYSAESGYWVSSVSFGNRVVSLFDAYQALPGGSVSTVNVRGTKKQKLANCMAKYQYRSKLHSTTHPIIRGYFEELVDPEQYSVAACQMGKLFEVLFFKCGCVPYYDSMRPQKDTDICTPAHLNTCVYRAFQNDPPVTTTSSNASDAQPTPSSAEDDVKRDLFQNMKELMATECLQLCESWIYDYTVFSTSIEDLEGNTSSINRTKVTIMFDPEYRVETEVYKMDPAAFIAALGDGLGLILGISAITLIQLPIWSVAACLLKRKQNKVSGLVKQAATPARTR